MKKSLHILLTVALCLLIFCAACGKDGTIDNNTDNTPDNTPVTDPDTTLPDSTADDKQNDVTPPDSTADDNKIPDTPAPPVQDTPAPPADPDPQPPVQDDNKQPDDTTPPAQDDTQQPDDTPYQLDPSIITEEYVISLIEEIEEWCNCLPFYSFNFEDASQLSSDSLLRAAIILSSGRILKSPQSSDTNITYYAQYASRIDISDVLDKWFKNYRFDITQCATYIEPNTSSQSDIVLTSYDPLGWQDLFIKVSDLTLDGNTINFTATLKKGWTKEYSIEFYEDGYYFLKAKEIEAPSADISLANENAVKAYYDFLNNGGKAYYLNNNAEITLTELIEYGNGTRSADPTIITFGLKDYDGDGVLEMRIDDENTYFKWIFYLFFENDKLYLHRENYRQGTAGTVYARLSFSADKGMEKTIFALSTSHQTVDGGEYHYYVYYDFVDGEYVKIDEKEVTEKEFWEYMTPYTNQARIKVYPIEYSNRVGQEFFDFEFYGLFECIKK